MEDNGQPFDPTQDSWPDVTSSLTARPVGGLGLHLVKKFADSLSYEFTDGWNRVTLEHRLEPATA